MCGLLLWIRARPPMWVRLRGRGFSIFHTPVLECILGLRERERRRDEARYHRSGSANAGCIPGPPKLSGGAGRRDEDSKSRQASRPEEPARQGLLLPGLLGVVVPSLSRAAEGSPRRLQQGGARHGRRGMAASCPVAASERRLYLGSCRSRREGLRRPRARRAPCTARLASFRFASPAPHLRSAGPPGPRASRSHSAPVPPLLPAPPLLLLLLLAGLLPPLPWQPSTAGLRAAGRVGGGRSLWHLPGRRGRPSPWRSAG